MSQYIGGPFDGKNIRTKYDDSPVLKLEFFEVVNDKPVRMVAHYELKAGFRVHIKNEKFYKGHG